MLGEEDRIVRSSCVTILLTTSVASSPFTTPMIQVHLRGKVHRIPGGGVVAVTRSLGKGTLGRSLGIVGFKLQGLMAQGASCFGLSSILRKKMLAKTCKNNNSKRRS